MQKQTIEETSKISIKDIHYKFSVLAIALATNLVLFSHHQEQRPSQARLSVKELNKMFEHEKETLHAPHNYGARGRYTVILGNE